MSRALPDVTAFCRRWRDSNGHLFTLERIEFDAERGGDRLLLHGVSSNCTCQERGLQFYSHDGPYTCYADSAHDLSTGFVFGWEPEPSSQADVARFVGFLLGLTDEEWSHISRVLDEEDDDFAEWVSADVCGAIYALQRVPALAAQSPEGGTGETTSTLPVHTVRAMMAAGHHDAPVMAAALLAGLSPTEAAALDPHLPQPERDLLIDSLMLLPALAETHP